MSSPRNPVQDRKREPAIGRPGELPRLILQGSIKSRSTSEGQSS
jgi:hypothetical protein